MNVSFNEMHEFYNEFQAILSAKLFASHLCPNFLTFKGAQASIPQNRFLLRTSFFVELIPGRGERVSEIVSDSSLKK